MFKLRKGVIFHDGEPFNAEAVRFTIERVLDPGQRSPNRANIAEVARVDVPDDFTVDLVTRQPYAPLLNRLVDFPIVPPEYTVEKGNQVASRDRLDWEPRGDQWMLFQEATLK